MGSIQNVKYDQESCVQVHMKFPLQKSFINYFENIYSINNQCMII